MSEYQKNIISKGLEIYHCPVCKTIFIDLMPTEITSATCCNCKNAFPPMEVLAE